MAPVGAAAGGAVGRAPTLRSVSLVFCLNLANRYFKPASRQPPLRAQRLALISAPCASLSPRAGSLSLWVSLFPRAPLLAGRFRLLVCACPPPLRPKSPAELVRRFYMSSARSIALLLTSCQRSRRLARAQKYTFNISGRGNHGTD